MLRVGLTGGIASGKSEVSRRLASYGAVVIDADKIAREVVGPGTAGLAAITQAFGDGVLRPDGSLDREKLGTIVFGDAERRKRLNEIVHPEVGARIQQLTDAAPDEAIVVEDVPLLVENGLASRYDLVIVVDAADDTRINRLTRARGMSQADAKARITAQASREERLAAADIVIDNNGTLRDLDRRVRQVWHQLRQRAGLG